MSLTRPLACCSRPGSGRAFFAPGAGIGVKQLCDSVEFSLGHSNMARLRGALAEDLIGIAVQCSGVSGNIAFKPLIPKTQWSGEINGKKSGRETARKDDRQTDQVTQSAGSCLLLPGLVRSLPRTVFFPATIRLFLRGRPLTAGQSCICMVTAAKNQLF